VRAFLRSGLDEQVVTLNAPERRDADDYECPREPQQIRLVRHVAPNGKVRVLMSNLFDTARFPASAFGDLYHKRWRIEEPFKRLKQAQSALFYAKFKLAPRHHRFSPSTSPPCPTCHCSGLNLDIGRAPPKYTEK
jgi:hypothetical protein